MILPNLRLAIRHLGRQKATSALHVIGLTLGMSVCLLIALLLRYEWSFDRYHAKGDRIYRITSEYQDANNHVYGGSTPVPLAESLRTGVAGIEHITLVHPFSNAQIEITPDRKFIEKNVLAVNEDFPDIFDIEVVAGDGRHALVKPYYALLTETTAKKFFGNENPLGKTFQLNREFNITVGGVIRDQPSNSSIPFSVLLSVVNDARFLGSNANDWLMTQGGMTFVLLRERADIQHFEAELKTIADKNINTNPNLPKGVRADLHLQHLKNIHFEPGYGGGDSWVPAVNTTQLWFFALIGFLVLVLACINFVNLSTARAVGRAKEVGIRKSVGARRDQLIGQFLMESCLIALVAGVLSVAIAQMSLPAMNTLLNKNIGFNPLHSIGLMGALLVTILTTGILAGLYPAWLIAQFNPAVNLKPGSSTTQDASPSVLRKGLVVVQFTFSIGLLIAVGLIGQQLEFLRGKKLGFNKENVINVPIGDVARAPILTAGLNQIPQVKNFSFSTGSPINGAWGGMASLTDGNDPDRVLITLMLADAQFSRLYDLKLLAGSFPLATDTNYISRAVPAKDRIVKVLANEKSIKDLGLESPDDAIGKRFWLSTAGKNAEIIGVVADFNTSSLHDPVNATMIIQRPEGYKEVGIRITANSNIPVAIAAIEKAWKSAYPEGVFQFNFLDQAIDDFYKAEMKLYTLFKVFAGLAMSISCVGLWGLATYAAQNRTKEIGIRKVLGASVNAVVLLLSKDFLSMVAIGLAVAAPLVYYFINNWLQHFAYHITIGWEIFAMAGGASILVALITVTIQTLKAALANPVDSLRSE